VGFLAGEATQGELTDFNTLHACRLANTLLEDEESARDNHALACIFAKYLPIRKIQ